MTLEESQLLKVSLEKVIQLGWFGTSTSILPSLFDKVKIDWMNDYSGSWIKIISKSFCASKIVLVNILFLYMFCEKILISLIIMLEDHLQLSKLIVF